MTRSSSYILGLVALSWGCGGDVSVVQFDNPPSVIINQPVESQTFEEGENIDFVGTVQDDGSLLDLTVEWTSSIDGVLPVLDPLDSTGIHDWVGNSLSPGTHIITFRATDAANQQGEAQVTIDIIDVPDLPTIQVLHPANGEQGVEGIPFIASVEVGDAQDDPSALQVEVVADPGGLQCYIVPDGAGRGTCELNLPIGLYLLDFTVTDLDDNTAIAKAAFEVVDPLDYDADGDGFTPNGGDCEDANPNIYPGAPEICDGLDNDCDPNTQAEVGSECWDDDGDGYCEQPPCANSSEFLPDCDDTQAAISPAGTESEIANGLDEDCDGFIDEGTSAYDDDGDGYCESPPCINATGAQPDCDDGDFNINPGAIENCATSFDENCNGLLDEQDALGCTNYFYDGDNDGFGVAGPTECWCDPTPPYTGVDANDCYDLNPSARPGQTAFFNGQRGDGSFDYNCDSTETKRYTSLSTGCQNSGISCDVSSGGWEGGVPSCGQSGLYLNDCDENWGAYLVNCGLVCSLQCAFGTSSSACINCLTSNCPNGMVCDLEYASFNLQECQ